VDEDEASERGTARSRGGGSSRAGIIPLQGCHPRCCLRFPGPGGPARALSSPLQYVHPLCPCPRRARARLGGAVVARTAPPVHHHHRQGRGALPPLLIGTAAR